MPPDPLNPERRAALRARAEEAQGRIGNWGPAAREAIQTEAQDILDLLAALETAEAERDRNQAVTEAAAAYVKAKTAFDWHGTPGAAVAVAALQEAVREWREGAESE
jgi:hypothetical protein